MKGLWAKQTDMILNSFLKGDLTLRFLILFIIGLMTTSFPAYAGTVHTVTV